MSVHIFRAALCRETNTFDIGLDTPFADLGIDPLAALSILAQVEESTGVAFPASLFRDCTCLGDLYKRLELPRASGMFLSLNYCNLADQDDSFPLHPEGCH